MIQHREFIASLSTAERRDFTQQSDQPGLLRLGILVLLIVLCSITITSRNTLWIPAIFLQGLLLMSLFHLLHECIHLTAFKTQSINKLVAAVCGFILFLPPTWFRYFHQAHHRYTQIPHKDPELASPKPDNLLQWVSHVAGWRIVYDQTKLYAKAIIQPANDDFIPARAKHRTHNEILLMGYCYFAVFLICLLAGISQIFWLWLLPLVLGQPFLRLYLLAEHADCPQDPNMFINTRTVMTNPILRWLTWNMPYHTEHHVFPTVPFHRLPQLHTKLESYLQNTSKGYVNFNRDFLATVKASPL